MHGTFVDWTADASTGTDVFLSTVVCYAAGTRILTATGERMVECLMFSHIVLTLSDGELSAQPVKWIGQRRIDLTAHPHPETVAPICIRRGAFADNMPHSDLLLSPDHAVFVDGKLITARQLVNGATIRQEKGWTSVEYFHVELDAHAILLAEGLPAESYLDTGNRGFFANSGEPMVLHPDLTDETGLSGCVARPVPARRSCRTWRVCCRCGGAWPTALAALGQAAPKACNDRTIRSCASWPRAGRCGRCMASRNGPAHLRGAQGRDRGAHWSHVPVRRRTRGRGWL